MKIIQKTFSLGICLTAAILCALPPAVKAGDVSLYAVYKRQIYQQTDTGTPVLVATPYIFNAFVEMRTPGSVKSASLAFGTNAPTPMMLWYENEFLPRRWIYGTAELFPTLAARETARPDGTYTFSIVTRDDGTQTPALTLTGDTYPPVPHIEDFAAAQSVDATRNFTVNWDAYAGGTTNDFIFCSVRTTNGNVVFSTRFLERPGHLDGTATSAVIPAGWLQPGQHYDAYVRFDKILVQDTNSYPGAVGSAGYACGTHFTLNTLPPPAPTNGPTFVSIFSPHPIVSGGTNSPSGAGGTPAASTSSWSGTNPATFVIDRSNCPTNDLTNDLTVYYSIAGTATNGVNYQALPGAVTIPAGQRTAGITVVPISTVNPPPVETVVLTLQSSTSVPPDYALGWPVKAAAIITGNGPRPRWGMLADGSFHCVFAGTNGWFEVDESTNLTDWSVICTNLSDQGRVQFVDPDAGSSSQRYYRAVPVDAPGWAE